MGSATRLFVGNIPDHTQEDDLVSAFSAFGKITNLDLKSKAASGNESKKFAFVSMSTQNGFMDVESCITHFTNKDFNGTRLYVTKARESFLERLQRERAEAQQKEVEKDNNVHQHQHHNTNPVLNLGDKLNPKKRKIGNVDETYNNVTSKKQTRETAKLNNHEYGDDGMDSTPPINNKKYEAERKRMESMMKKRQEFKEKKMIIKTGLTGVDKVQNKKMFFDDNIGDSSYREIDKKGKESKQKLRNGNSLFNDDVEESDDEVNFEVKEQFEGKKGQKVLDLQSRYKTDKRFTLDERFIEDEADAEEREAENEEIELGHADEKAKQLNILEGVLGVTLKTKINDSESKKTKPKIGMLRFDPMQPDHAKFLAPVEAKPEPNKKSKKKIKEKNEIKEKQPILEVPKVEVSKDQFYKVSDSLKEAIAQPNTFSLRSLFGQSDNIEGPQKQDTDYKLLEMAKDKKKVKNPLDPTDKNPFVYDSSDSETEEPEKKMEIVLPPPTEAKAVWKENLFFSETDSRLKEGLLFFTQVQQNEVQKDRRELKSLVKKRLYNNDRKNQMFKKKIGGRKKSMKKPYKKKN